jgi:hypothetical protein
MLGGMRAALENAQLFQHVVPMPGEHPTPDRISNSKKPSTI